MKLTLKMPAVVVSAILLTAVGTGAVSVGIGRYYLRQTTLDHMLQNAEIYAGATLSYVGGARSLLATTAELPQLKSLAQPRELAVLALGQSDVFEYVMLLTPDGAIEVLEPRALEGQLSHRDLSFSAWFTELRRTHRSVVSDLHISPATQRPTIMLATPVRAADGQTVGIWAAGLKLENLSKIGAVAAEPVQRKESGYMTDRRGLIIGHQNRPDFVENQTDFSTVFSVSEALAGRTGASELFNAIEGEQKFAGYLPLPGLGWAVVFRVPAAVALAPLTDLTRAILLASLALAALIGVDVFVLARRTVAPLARLSVAAQTVGTGDFSQRLEVPSGDEIGQLAQAFNRMADALAEKDGLIRTRTANLETANQDLADEIAERKKVEEKVRAAALYARSLIEASLDPLVTINPQGKITDVNEASIHVTGIARNALIGTDFSDYFTEPQKARQGYQLVFTQGFVTDYPLTIRRCDGKLTEVLYNACVYKNSAGEAQGVFAAARDITQQREATDALAASARALARSNAELEQFAYVASHDLQEPLRMVVGYVQLLEKRLADKLDADTREFMGFAVDGALRMQNLIQDILAYSRVSTKGQPLAPVDSAAALKEALDQLASRIAETGAVVEAQSLPVVMADRSQLVQLFQNLIGNAIKFCKGQAPRVHVEAAHEAGRWRFSVTDNGIGIAAEYRAQLFVIFKRLHTRREYPGTGIGLAVCKSIVERHGGEIGIESAPAGGSVFWFTVPEGKCP